MLNLINLTENKINATILSVTLSETDDPNKQKIKTYFLEDTDLDNSVYRINNIEALKLKETLLKDNRYKFNEKLNTIYLHSYFNNFDKYKHKINELKKINEVYSLIKEDNGEKFKLLFEDKHKRKIEIINSDIKFERDLLIESINS